MINGRLLFDCLDAIKRDTDKLLVYAQIGDQKQSRETYEKINSNITYIKENYHVEQL